MTVTQCRTRVGHPAALLVKGARRQGVVQRLPGYELVDHHRQDRSGEHQRPLEAALHVDEVLVRALVQRHSDVILLRHPQWGRFASGPAAWRRQARTRY